MRNGPQSAGAYPGPACYGFGGTEPTNTDANLVLGRLNVELLGGSMKLDLEKAKQAVQKIADAFGYSIEEAANAIIEVANANMSDALRLISVRRGYDPREFALVAFGGAGPLHGAYLAKELNIPTVIIPPYPGVAAAMGCLLVDVRHDISKTYLKQASEVTLKQLLNEFESMQAEAKVLLQEEGISEEHSTLMNFIDLRYQGQWRSLAVPVSKNHASMEEILELFHREHEREFAYSDRNQNVEIFGLRVTAIGTVPKPEFPKYEPNGSIENALKGNREVYFDGRFVKTNIYDRDKIPVLSVIEGPAIIEQLDTTTVIPPKFTAKVDIYKNIIISVNQD